MRFLDVEVERAVEEGRVKQVLVADGEGFVLENVGNQFDPESLAAAFSPSHGLAQRLQETLGCGLVGELAVRLEPERLRIVVRYLLHDNERFMIVVVLSTERGWRLLTNHIIRKIME